MVHPEVIRKRLTKLQEYLLVLEDLKVCTVEEFVSSPRLYGSAERFLHLAIEALNDMGGYLIADEDMGSVEWQRDIPRILLKKGLLTEAKADTWIRMIGFRNILVHDYLDIDRREVFAILSNHLSDIRSLSIVFAEYL